MDDTQLEELTRDSLARRAEEAVVDPTVLARARAAAVRGRRRARLLVAGGAAAAVAAVVGVTAVMTSPDSATPEPPVVVDPPTPPPPSPSDGWRVEVWHGVRFEVPADWGYGASPQRNDNNLFVCGGGPAVDAEGRRGIDPRTPYVGRPVGLSDLCGEPPLSAPDHVWISEDAFEPGTVELANGTTQETVEVAGVRVSVASNDEALRERIVASVAPAQQVSGCETTRERDAALERVREVGDRAVAGLRVCVYDTSRFRGGARLQWAAVLGTAPARAYAEATSALPAPADQCPTTDYQLQQAVLLELIDDEGSIVRRDVVNPTSFCAGLTVRATRLWPLEAAPLTRAMVEPWAVGAVPVLVYGGPEDSHDLFVQPGG